MSIYRRHLLLSGLALITASAAWGTTDRIALTASADEAGEHRSASVTAKLSFPGDHTLYLFAPTSSWIHIEELQFDISWPDDAPTNAQVLVYTKDWDYFWYQTLCPGYLVPGRTNRFGVDLSPGSEAWHPRYHHGRWHFRNLLNPRQVGLKLFSDQPYKGTCTLGNLVGVPPDGHDPPYIRNVRANSGRVACYERFELTFDIPDRYADPFDPQQVAVTGDFETPDGRTVTVDGFYSRRYYREVMNTREKVVPQGPPHWCLRFTPVVEGGHTYTLTVRDRHGEAHWGSATFEATAASQPGFVRVAKRDPRFFEFDDGSTFFPVGHNIRSPFDTRMDSQFPWRQRWPEGTTAYARYFEAMGANGENISEVWMAAWSLGLEWSPGYPGYRGVGQFNVMNAWELDRVLEEAERNHIYVNLVIHNHGKFTTCLDHEWEDNPFNVANGGYLDKPEDYFTDHRAHAAFRKLMRYIIARWGYSTRIFAWQLWSELDLVGSKDGYHHHHRRPELVEWHKVMGQVVKDMDPYDHMVSTHVSGDYTKQSREIIGLDSMDLCPIDAYHFSADPLHIIELMRKTVAFNDPFRKPVLITEFGGSHMAQGLKHLRETLHAGLWSSVAIPLGAAPMFWWWQVVDEENLYPMFGALSRFMKGVDRRDPSMKMHRPALLVGEQAASGLAVECMRSPRLALGWIYHTERFPSIDPSGEPTVMELTVRLDGMSGGAYDVEFWDTMAGKAVSRRRYASRNGLLVVQVPPFARDIAFKARRHIGR